MQPPPPRKVKHSVALKNVQTEQHNKLQTKQNLETELVDDIRAFSKQRSVIEKEYAQALCKLAQQYLNKRQFPLPPNVVSEDGKEHKTITTVWKTVIEETDRIGKMRLQAADTYLQQISDPCKTIKAQRVQNTKKIMDQAVTLQKEVAQTVGEMVKAQKVYNEEEHVAHEARTKAADADAKVKNKKSSIFTSMATLQKSSAKLNTRKEQCEQRSTAARNEYLLHLSAANTHQIRYYSTDLPELLKFLDGEMYEQLRDFFITMARAELECCGTVQECFTKIMCDAGLISRQYNLQCFLHENLVFTDLLQYQFEPQDGDLVNKVSSEHSANHQLDKEARKWATKIAKENKAIREYTRQLQVLQTQTQAKTEGERKPSESSQDGGPQSPVDPEIKLEEIKQNIRKAETGKLKAEARIEALRLGGVNVDDWLNSANAEALVPEEDEKETSQRSSSSISIKTDSSSGLRSRNESTKDDGDGNSIANSSLPNDSTYINYQEEDDFIDETFDQSGNTSAGLDTSSTGYSSGRTYPLKCSAIYTFAASNADELNMEEGEELTLIADGDGDGWVRAQNSKGDTGFIPENYIQLSEQNGYTEDPNEMNVDGDPPSSAGYESSSLPPSSAGYDSGSLSSAPPSAGLPAEHVSSYSAADYEVQQVVICQEASSPTGSCGGVWVKALYDYDATCGEELSFVEGQMIRVLRKDVNGVDDGWWEGEVEGRTGVFPSLVVEELNENGNLAGDSALSPMGTGPPPFTPPEPGPPPPQLEITQPTPSDEHLPSPPAKTPELDASAKASGEPPGELPPDPSPDPSGNGASAAVADGDSNQAAVVEGDAAVDVPPPASDGCQEVDPSDTFPAPPDPAELVLAPGEGDPPPPYSVPSGGGDGEHAQSPESVPEASSPDSQPDQQDSKIGIMSLHTAPESGEFDHNPESVI